MLITWLKKHLTLLYNYSEDVIDSDFGNLLSTMKAELNPSRDLSRSNFMKTRERTKLFSFATALTLSMLCLFSCRAPDGTLESSGGDAGDSGTLSVSSEVKTLKVSGGNTYFKISMDAAFTLSEEKGQRCLLFRDTTLRYSGELSFANNHLKLTITDDTQPGCPFRTGYLFGSKYEELADAANAINGGKTADAATPSVLDSISASTYFADYNAQTGAELAAAIKKPAYCSVTGSVVGCGPTASSRGCCYSCVAGPNSASPGALSRYLPSLGRAIWPVGTAPELNTRSYARSFAEYFVPARHEAITHMRAAYLKGKVDKVAGVSARFKMPVGSVIVWSSCSTSAAGHIAIVTEEGKKACSDFCGSLDQCSSSNIIGMFYPFK